MNHKQTVHEATQRVEWLKQDLAKAEQALEDAWVRQTPREGGSMSDYDKLRELVRGAKAEAWDEGMRIGALTANHTEAPTNPYKEEA